MGKTFALFKTFSVLVVLSASFLFSGCSEASLEPDADAALDYLATQDLSGDWAVRALVAVAGQADPAAWPTPEAPILERLPSSPSTTHLVPLATGWSLHGLDPRDYRGTDLVARIQEGYHDSFYGGEPSLVDDALALRALALAGVNDAKTQGTVTRLVAAQAQDGGWSWDGGEQGDTDVSSWVVQALAAADALDAVKADARSFLAAGQHGDGAYSSLGVGPNCQSTGLAVQAYQAMELDPPASSLAYLVTCQRQDGGFAHTPDEQGSDLWATLDILPALRS